MLEKQIFGSLSSLISFVVYIPYVIDIFKNKTKPHTFSWFVWTVLSSIAFFIQIVGGAGPGAWLMGTTTLISFFIFTLALKKGTKDITKIDWISLFGALSAMVFWIITKTPLLSVILVIITDGLAWFPTIRKSFYKPFEETIVSYFFNVIKFVLGLLALQTFSFITAFYLIYLIFVNGLFVTFLYIRRRQIAK